LVGPGFNVGAPPLGGRWCALYKRILVGFDGSPESLEALRRASELASASGAELHVIAVVPPPSVILGPLMTPETFDVRPLVEAARGALERAVGELEGVSVHWEVRVGEPASTILDYAEEAGVDLIVLGRRRLRGVERIALGSVSSKVVSHSPVDVLVVKHSPEG